MKVLNSVGLSIVAIVGVSGLPVPINHSLLVHGETWISSGSPWNSYLSVNPPPNTAKSALSIVAIPNRNKPHTLGTRDTNPDLSSILDLLPEAIHDKLGTIVPQLQSLIPKDTWDRILNVLGQASNTEDFDVQSLVDLVPQDVRDKLAGLENISVDEIVGMVPENIRDKIPNLESIITSFVGYLRGETTGTHSASSTNGPSPANEINSFPFELFNFNQ